jgi:SAM-dependent methyltransferase
VTAPIDKTAQQFRQWPYPKPVDDLAQWQARVGPQQCDPCFNHAVLWPERPYNPRLNILIAGCGTNEAALQAYNQPEARVVGIDLSATSLEHQQKLKLRHNLTNLELHELDLHDVSRLDEKFDLIVSYGVIQLQAAPAAALQALATALADGGVMLIWLYARYLRHGLYMMQDALRRLAFTQTAADLDLLKQMIDALPPWHPLRLHLALATDLGYDAGLVDSFLPIHDRAFTVPEVLDLARTARLDFQGWFDNLHYYPEAAFMMRQPELYARIKKLPIHEQWAAVELLVPPGGHTCLLRKPGQADAARIDLASPSWDHLVPGRRHNLTSSEDRKILTLRREWHSVILNERNRALFNAVDDRRTIGDIMRHTGIAADEARAFFDVMWRCGHMTLAKTAS